MKNEIISILFAVAAIIVSALSSAHAEKNPIKIGALFSLSSYGAEGGVQELAGARLAIQDSNASGGVLGRPVELVVEDNQTDLAKSVTAFRLLKNAGVAAVIGPNWAEYVEVVAPIARQEKLVTLSPSGWSKNIFTPGSYLFSGFESHDENVKPLAAEIAKRKPSKLFALVTENSFCVEIFESLKRRLATEGIQFQQVEYSNPGAVDFRTLIGRFVREKPDLLFLNLIQDGGNAAFLRQFKNLKATIPLISSVTMPFEQTIQDDPKLTEGIPYLNYLTPEQIQAPRELTALLQAEINTTPLPTAYISYDLTKHLLKALTCSKGVGGG